MHLLQQELGTGNACERDGSVAACDDVLESLGFREECGIRDGFKRELGQSD